jgi:hypothetical protein
VSTIIYIPGSGRLDDFVGTDYCPLVLLFLCKTIPAKNRPAFGWLERNFAFLSAFAADCLVHLSGSAVKTPVSAAESAFSVFHAKLPLLFYRKHQESKNLFARIWGI